MKMAALPFPHCKPRQLSHEKAQNPTGAHSPGLLGPGSLSPFHHRELMLKLGQTQKPFHLKYASVCCFYGLEWAGCILDFPDVTAILTLSPFMYVCMYAFTYLC